jgi:WhiB family redox-sensing transcriptional regulator
MHRLRELQNEGLCTVEGSHELFFSERPSDLAQAQAICGRCPVKALCLQFALQSGAEWGVWGGMIFWDAYHRRRGRGRPRLQDQHLPVEADIGELMELVKSA